MRIASPLLILVGLGLLGAAAPTPGVSDVDITRQRARFEGMESIPAATPTALRVSSATPVPDTAPIVVSTGASEHLERPPHATGSAGTPVSTPTRVATPDRIAGSPTPTVTPSPAAIDMPPATHITIPAVGVDTDVLEVDPSTTMIDGQLVLTWQVADWAAGHHATSADPGEGGNIVIAGHDDVRGEVFRGLHDIEVGDRVQLTSATGAFDYIVIEVHLRRERDAPLQERLATGVFMAPMPEERLTLITCWPYGVDDHRLIVVATPQSTLLDQRNEGR